jgi:gliding motility-associated protein GldM
MSGGKESPRQKMVGMMYLVLTALLALNVSKSILAAFVAIEENIQISNETEFFRGNEKRSELAGVASDQSVPDRAKKAAALLKSVEKIDELTAKRIKLIDDIKLEILTLCQEKIDQVGPEHIITRKYEAKKSPLRPIRMNLEKVEAQDKYDEPMHILIGDDIKKPAGRGDELWKSYNKYRAELVETMATYSAGEEKEYNFKAPNINKFKDQKDLMQQIEKAIASSNVAMDDKEPIKKIYASLTKQEMAVVHEQEAHWVGKTFDHSPVVAALASLSSMQKEILAARADAVAVIRARVGGGEYSFNKIMPLVVGPELANTGDEVRLNVLMAAYDSDKQPEVTMNGVKIEEVRDGMAFISTKASGGNEMVLEGEITIRNKSGMAKTRKWSKTIKIMKPMGTVSLPDLNVLYRGYENRIDAVASGYDQTVLSGNGVSLSKNGGGWIGAPGKGRECTITVSGKSSLTNKTVSLGAFKFRVSSLPDPELYFGAAKSGTNASKSETRLFAKYPPEIPLKADFRILDWELSVPGNPGAPPRGVGSVLDAKGISLLRQAKPGTTISFITSVVGPDGIKRKKAGAFSI